MSYDKVRRNMKRHKYAGFPPAPQDVEGIRQAFADVKVKAMFGSSKDGSEFYVGSEEGGEAVADKYGFAVFASATVMKKLPTLPQREYFVDGTFSVVPSGKFKQLLVIHVQHGGHVSIQKQKQIYIY